MQREFDWSVTLRAIERNVEGYLAVLLATVYLIAIVWNVFARNVIGSQHIIPDALSITLGMVAWVAWLSASWGVRRQSHLRFLLLRDRFSQRIQYGLFVLEWGLWLLINGVILWVALPIAQREMATGVTTPELNIPAWIFYLSIPVGFSLILFRTLQQSYYVTKRYRNGEPIKPTSEIIE